MLFRLSRPLAAAAAAAVLAVSAPTADAGRGDLGKATHYAASLERHARAAGQFGAVVGRPDYIAFANTAHAIEAEACALTAKLACGDIAAARACTAQLGGLVKILDRQEDRLSKCGYRGRDARKAADDFADCIEDAYDDLEDEVEDLRGIPVVHRHAPGVIVSPPIGNGRVPHPPIVTQPGPALGNPGFGGQPGFGTPAFGDPGLGGPGFGAPGFGGGFDQGGLGGPAVVQPPRYDARPLPGGGGFQYQGESDGRGLYYGPSRGSVVPSQPNGGVPGGGGLYDGFAPGPGAGFDVRDRDGFRPVPNRGVPGQNGFRQAPAPLPAPQFDGGAGGPFDGRFNGPALPGPQAGFGQPGGGAGLYGVDVARADRGRFEEDDLKDNVRRLLRDVIFRR